MPSPKWRDLGDFYWVLVMMENKVSMVVSDHFTSACAVWRGTFFVETDELFHLYAAKSGTAGDDGRAQHNVSLVEPAVT